jgi:hypothetical protein
MPHLRDRKSLGVVQFRVLMFFSRRNRDLAWNSLRRERPNGDTPRAPDRVQA